MKAVIVALFLSFCLVVIAGTAFLVWHGWSPWWFLAAFIFLTCVRLGDDL